MSAENELEKAKRHIRDAEEHVALQKADIDELRRDGHPTLNSEIMLKTFERSLELHRECWATLLAAQPSKTVD